MSYIGNSPGVASQRVTTTLTATAGQTQFTTQSGYVLGYVDVYLNGVKLVNGADFEAITGTYVSLFAGALAGDVVELVSYVPRGLTDGYTKAEADAKFLDVGGDSASGTINLGANGLVVGTTQLVTVGGKIGIGTATPVNGLLNVSNATNQISIDQGAAATYGRLDIGHFTNGTFIGTYAGSNAVSDVLRLGTSGTERARIDSSGNIAIGKQSASSRLHISGSSGVNGAAVTLDIGAQQHAWYLSDSFTSVFNIGSGSASSAWVWTYSGGEVARLTTAGLGINTTSLAGLKLVAKGVSGYPATSGTTQNGVFRVTGGTGLYNVLDMGVNESTDAAWIQATRANSLGTYDSLLLNPYGGKIGVGTTSPAVELDVRARARFGDGTNHVTLGYWDGFSNRIESVNKPLFLTSYSDSIRFGMSGSESMRIDTAGNVLVGVTSSNQSTGGCISIAANKFIHSNGFGRLWMQAGKQIGQASYAGLYGPALTYMAKHDGTNWLSTGGGSVSALTMDEGILSFSNQTGFSAGDQTINWVTRLVVDTVGRVAINNTNPQNLLHIVTPNGQGLRTSYSTATDLRYSIVQHGGLTVYSGATNNDCNIEMIGGNGNIIFNNTSAPNGTPTEKARIDSNGNFLIGTTSASGKLTVSAPAAYGNLSTGTTLTLANTVSGGTNTNNINVGVIDFGTQATNSYMGRLAVVQNNPSGSTASFMQFFINNGGGNAGVIEAMRINSNGTFTKQGVREFYTSGGCSGISAFSIDISIPNDNSGTATVCHIEAAFSHANISGYGCLLDTWHVARGDGSGFNEKFDNKNVVSGNGGSWSVSKAGTGTLRVTKNAGTYNGGGPYWIRVTFAT